eukprot:1150842-Pelagomonas_calceolata.AAC.4
MVTQVQDCYELLLGRLLACKSLASSFCFDRVGCWQHHPAAPAFLVHHWQTMVLEKVLQELVCELQLPHAPRQLMVDASLESRIACSQDMERSMLLRKPNMEFSAQHHNHHTRVAFQGLHAVLSPLKWPLCMAARKRRDH